MYKQEEGIVLKGSLFPPLLHEQEKQTEEDEDGYFFSLYQSRLLFLLHWAHAMQDGAYLKARLHWHKWTRKLSKIVAYRSNVATIFSPRITALTIFIWKRSLLLFYPAGASFMSQRGERERKREKGTCSLSFPCCRRPSPPPQFMDSEQGGRHGEVHTPTVAHIKPPKALLRAQSSLYQSYSCTL